MLNVALSMSPTTKVLLIGVAALFSVYASVAPVVTVGASLSAVTLIVEVTPTEVCAPTASELASVTAQVTVRVGLVAPTVGSSELRFEKVTLRKAVW